MFQYIAGIALLILLYAHYVFFVGVDRVYPECFRKCRYGACSYYKEFYDPVSHKTERPFVNDPVQNELHINNLNRSDYKDCSWTYNWKGNSLKTYGKEFTDYSGFAAVSKKTPSDTERIVDRKSGDPVYISKDSSILNKDFTKDLEPLA